MKLTGNIRIGVAALLAAGGLAFSVPAASAAPNPGTCSGSDFCLYFNSDFKGATFEDGRGNSQTPENYGAPNWYRFSGGNGAGSYVKNNAASAWNFNLNYSVTVYFNSNNSGPSQFIKRLTGANLNDQLKNNNASQCLDFFQYCP
ncbi:MULTISPECIES: peptidase inhibitor family I36 protein [Kitasatospora]|uniref:peptidase inhibitor family I36 protein n=1 Tax=Kitasatospora TaxID=2063 RepID=UPI0005BCAA0A|nr:peptidase inhibitor family I36 protein [Kitasatospora sp. MBT66]